MLMSSGFTDDLFPADETIRYYNRTRTQFRAPRPRALLRRLRPHARPEQAATSSAPSARASRAWLDYYVKGTGPRPQQGVEAWTETCPKHGSVGRPLSRAQLGPHRARRGPLRATRPRRRSPPTSTTGGGVQPGRRARACADRAATSTRPGPRSTGSAPAPGGRLHPARRADGGRQLHAAGRHLAGRRAAARRRARRHRDAGRPRAVAAGHRRPEAAGVPAASQRLDLRRRPRAEARAARGGRRRRGAGELRPPVERTSSRSPCRSCELRLPVVERPGAAGGLVRYPAPKVVPYGSKLAADWRTGHRGPHRHRFANGW